MNAKKAKRIRQWIRRLGRDPSDTSYINYRKADPPFLWDKNLKTFVRAPLPPRFLQKPCGRLMYKRVKRAVNGTNSN